MWTWESLRKECENCRGCILADTRTHMVFGVGRQDAEVMLIGEGPGEQEDLQGVPFVGPAGKLLDSMLEMIDLDRSKVYIAHMVKCRPPHNRDPQDIELFACSHWLQYQTELVSPKIIVCLGRIAAQGLISKDFRITRDHGKWYDKNGVRYMATFHPSALLRNPASRPDAFMDLRELRKEIRAVCDSTY